MRIKSHAPWMWLGMSLASLGTLALPSIYLYLMRQDGRDRWFVYLFIAPFLLVGLLLGYFGLRALLRIVVRGSGGKVTGMRMTRTCLPASPSTFQKGSPWRRLITDGTFSGRRVLPTQ